MKLTVDVSKITPPLLPRALDRPRLLKLLQKNGDRRLILILGQAAQGKSTLAASYAKISTIPTAWMNLGHEDSDPVSLFYLMCQSLQHVFREIDFSRFFSYSSGPPPPMPEIVFSREWARSLFELIPNPVEIVMDGLDRLSPDAPVFKLLQILVEEARPHIHLIMLSREMPPLTFEFQHLKVKQEAFILTNEELAFTLEETRDYFRKIQKIPLDSDQLRMVHSLTEGWIGGLILLSEFINRSSESSKKKKIPQELPDRFRREVFQYFGKEIFSSQPQQVQQFLVKSSILQPIEARFAKDLLGAQNAAEILQGFARRNLFVQSTYDSKEGWLFRYHQLFRNFLNAKFESELGEEDKRFLFLKAAYLFEQKGELENALKYFLKAKAHPQAISIIETLGRNLLRMGRKNDLSQWVLSFPQNLIEDNPWLLFYLAMTLHYMKGKEYVIYLEKAYQLFKQKGDLRGTFLSLSQLMIASIRTGFRPIPVERLIEEGEKLLQSPDLEQFQYERAMLGCYAGIGHLLVDGNIQKGLEACQNAKNLSTQIGDINLQAYAMVYLTIGLICVGEFARAEESTKQIENLNKNFTSPEVPFLHLFVSCILSNHQGHFSKTQSLVVRLQSEIKRLGLVSVSPWIYEVLGCLRLGQEALREAEEIVNVYLNMIGSRNNLFLKALALRLLGLIFLQQGRFDEGKEPIERAINIFSRESPNRYELYRVKSIMGLLCTHLKEYQRADREFEEVLQYYSNISSHIWMAETHLSIGLLKWSQGMIDQAALSLKTGFEIAREKRYEHFFILGEKYLLKACLLALELKVEGIADYVTHLLSTRLSAIAEEDLKKLSSHPDPEIREKAWRIRRTIHRSKAPQLRIETLGGFLVYRGDHLVGEKEWDRHLPKQLLMAIASYGTQKISKDLLVDDLWPDAGLASGMRNLKTTLHRLRKSLEPGPYEGFSSFYIHLHGNYVFLDQELVQVDVDQFLSLIKKGEEEEKAGNLKQSLSFYAAAVDVYKGDFLPELSDASWADRRREEFREKFIELLHTAAKLYEKQGSLRKAISCYKKAIQADPLIEESYQKLMTLYSNTRMQNEALRTYEACKKALKEGLKTKPDPTTTALYEKILEKLHA